MAAKASGDRRRFRRSSSETRDGADDSAVAPSERRVHHLRSGSAIRKAALRVGAFPIHVAASLAHGAVGRVICNPRRSMMSLAKAGRDRISGNSGVTAPSSLRRFRRPRPYRLAGSFSASSRRRTSRSAGWTARSRFAQPGSLRPQVRAQGGGALQPDRGHSELPAGPARRGSRAVCSRRAEGR